MRPYISALVISVSLVSTGAFAQASQPQTGAGAPAAPVRNGLPPGFANGKSYVNTEMQRTNNALQQEVQRLVDEGKLKSSAEYSGPIKPATTEKAKEKDFKEFNKLSQGLVNDSVSDLQMQKRIVETDDKKKPEAPEPITNLSPSMRKSANDDTAITAQLIDGQYVVFRNNGSVTIMNERGRAILPPDGILTLKDGTTFTIKDGMRTE